MKDGATAPRITESLQVWDTWVLSIQQKMLKTKSVLLTFIQLSLETQQGTCTPI